MNKSKYASEMISDVLNETYTYLEAKYGGEEIETLKNTLLSLVKLKSFEFIPVKGKHYSYENIQEVLSTLNEKESIRKNKGVYYTPPDVVQFIVENSIKSAYGKLGVNGLRIMDLNGIPYRSFCMTKLVLDPTCGAGEFLLMTLDTKFNLLDSHVESVTEGMIKGIVSTIYGNDINSESTDISKIRLFLCALRRYGLKRCRSIAEILNKNFYNMDFISQTPDFHNRFDMIIGNPPYVEDSKSNLVLSKNYGNIYANVLINSAELLSESGSLGFIIPLSYVSTPRMKSIRNDLFRDVSEQYILSYADRPDCLFKSVHQKLCILFGRKKKSDKRVYTGNYQYWYKEERETLFDHTTAVKNCFAEENYIPKLGTRDDVEIYKKVCGNKAFRSLSSMQGEGSGSVYINMRAAFWIKAFLNSHVGSEYKHFSFGDKEMASYVSCLVNSSLFWWYWICVSDCWHITGKELRGFKAPQINDYKTVVKLAESLENKLEVTKLYVGTKQTEYEYKHKSCIDEIHAIDDYINTLYGLSDAENLYIKNFAYRYRVSGGVE